MTQLANANLLDDDLANGSSLKNRRLNKVAQKAVNPIKRESNPMPKMKPKVVEEKIEDEYDDEISTPNQQPQIEEEYQETERYSAPKSSFYADQQRYFDENNKSNTNSKVDDEKKILGMKPALFYGILAVGVLVGGYFVYKKFFNKKGGKSDIKPLGNSGGNQIPNANPNPTPTPNVASGVAPTDIIT